MPSRILFLDFDGTITSEETLEAAMRICLPREMILDGLNRIRAGEWTLKDAVTFAFDSIPSSRLPEIMEYVRNVPVREGLGDLLDRMRELGIPTVVISGGLKPYVEEKLAPYRDRILDVYSLDVDATGPFIKLTSPCEGETDLIDKPKIMEKYDFDLAICVGDGLTDIDMAMSSQKVFARGILAEELAKRGAPFTLWEDFYDIIWRY